MGPSGTRKLVRGLGRVELGLFLTGLTLSVANVFVMGLGRIGQGYDSAWEYFLLVSGPLALSLSAAVALVSGRLRALRRFYRQWMVSVLFGLVGLVVVGFIRVIFSGESVRLRTFGYDILTWSYFVSSVLVGAKGSNWRAIDRWLVVQFLLGAAVAACSWATNELTKWVIDRPLVTWTTPYYMWQLLYPWSYLILTFDQGGLLRRLAVLAGSGTYATLSMAFQKRVDLVGILSLPVICALIDLFGQRSTRQLKALIRAYVGLAAGALLLMLALGLVRSAPIVVDLTWHRFVRQGTLGQTILQDYRVSGELGALLAELSGLDWLLGKGFGGTMTGWGDKVTGVVHNGLVMIVLKGGCVFLVLWTVGWVALAIEALRNKSPALNCYYVPTLMACAFFVFASFVAAHPRFAFVGLCAGRCMSSELRVHTGHRGSAGQPVSLERSVCGGRRVG